MLLLVDYDPATGRPICEMTVWPPAMKAHLVSLGRSVAEGEHPGVPFHVVDGAIVARPAHGASVAVDGMTLTVSGAPEGTVLRVEFDGVSTETAEMSIEVDEPGDLRLTILPPWPFVETVHDLPVG